MADVPEAYRGLVLPPGYDPAKTNYRIATWLGGFQWYFIGTGIVSAGAAIINPFYLIASGLNFGISFYLRYEKKKTMEMAHNVEAERKQYYKECERRMRAELGTDLSDKVSDELP